MVPVRESEGVAAVTYFFFVYFIEGSSTGSSGGFVDADGLRPGLYKGLVLLGGQYRG